MQDTPNKIHYLSAFHLQKTYKKRKVVEDVSLNLSNQEIVGLLGPNGAGKTTCFYMILGLIACDLGQIKLDDQYITELPVHERAKRGIGYLPQEASVFRKLSVADNILAILQTRSDLSAQQQSDKLDQLLQDFNLNNIADSMGFNLSGGERRRLEIARLLALSPSFVLLDEPFAGVDPISIVEIKKIMKNLKSQGIGILITDHNVRDTLDICDRAYIVNGGQVIAEGQPEKVLENQKVREVYLGDSFVV